MDWIFWLVLVVFLSFIEATTVNLVTIWFVVSGIVALVLSFFISDVAILSSVFVILGVIFLFLSRPIVKKLRTCTKECKTNLDRIIGLHGIVTEEIKKNELGEVKVDGKRWSAISKENIKKDEELIVDAIDGVKLIVRKEC